MLKAKFSAQEVSDGNSAHTKSRFTVERPPGSRAQVLAQARASVESREEVKEKKGAKKLTKKGSQL